jgi:4-amino-4-deoxy-L-arabinose transferase-like glycosyltransferase
LFQLLNVLFVCIADIAVLLLAKTLFDDPRIELLTAILLGLCIQPMLLSTFLYGTVPGMTFSIWSIYFVATSMKKKKLTLLIPAAVLIALAILLKKNFLIVLIAEGVLLLIFALRNRKPLVLAFVALMAALAVLFPNAVQKQYEARADATFGKGTPQIAWLVTGLRESSLCFGWYNSYTTTVLKNNDMDYDQTLAKTKRT